jgi:rhamnosyltransferase
MMYDNSVVAGIVVYFPNQGKLIDLLESLEKQVSVILIFNNGVAPNSAKDIFDRPNVRVFGNGKNLGVASAINELCLQAITLGASYIVTFDQDTLPSYDFVANLSRQYHLLSTSKNNIAAVGPKFIDKRNGADVYPIFQNSKYWVKKVYPDIIQLDPLNTSLLITSGMLLDLNKWKAIGRFRDDYFIDYVDNEWCIRAASLGYDLYVCPSIVIQHELSDMPPRRLFGRLALSYSPVRRYYTFRNAVDLMKKQYVPTGMRLYLFATLIYRTPISLIIDRDKWATLSCIAHGLIDGIAGKLGKKDF